MMVIIKNEITILQIYSRLIDVKYYTLKIRCKQVFITEIITNAKRVIVFKLLHYVVMYLYLYISKICI
jgi:hypothetical protein